MFMGRPRKVVPDKQRLNNEGHKNGFDHGPCRAGNDPQYTLEHPGTACVALMQSTEHTDLQPSLFTPFFYSSMCLLHQVGNLAVALFLESVNLHPTSPS